MSATTVIARSSSTGTGEKVNYELHSDHQLYVVYDGGEFSVGYVSDPEAIDTAIFNHEEEMMILMAEAKAEFGF